MLHREDLRTGPETHVLTTNHETPWQNAEFEKFTRSKFRSLSETLEKYWRIITVVLLATIVALQLAIWSSMSGNLSKCRQQVGTEYRSLAPNFPTEVIQWKADYDFVPLNASEFLDPKISAKWATLLPESALKEFPEDGLVYSSTSVTHQLHCVYIMGKIFSAVLTKSPNIPEPEDYEPHFLHCVDYMRQAAMCAGDIAIEPRGMNGQRGPIDLDTAFNGSHVCKDYELVKAYLNEQIREGAREILPLDD